MVTKKGRQSRRQEGGIKTPSQGRPVTVSNSRTLGEMASDPLSQGGGGAKTQLVECHDRDARGHHVRKRKIAVKKDVTAKARRGKDTRKGIIYQGTSPGGERIRKGPRHRKGKTIERLACYRVFRRGKKTREEEGKKNRKARRTRKLRTWRGLPRSNGEKRLCKIVKSFVEKRKKTYVGQGEGDTLPVTNKFGSAQSWGGLGGQVNDTEEPNA